MAKNYVSLNDDFDHAVAVAATVLEGGGLIIFPTETVYGIGVINSNALALTKLQHLKRRDGDKPFQLLAADVTMARDLGAIFSPQANKLADKFWPGPLTLVLPDTTGSTLGIRIPNAPFILALCRRLNITIVSSSANPASTPPPLTADAADIFGDEADLLVDGGCIHMGVPSTVVRCQGNDYEILRQGSLGNEAIESAWNESPA